MCIRYVFSTVTEGPVCLHVRRLVNGNMLQFNLTSSYRALFEDLQELLQITLAKFHLANHLTSHLTI